MWHQGKHEKCNYKEFTEDKEKEMKEITDKHNAKNKLTTIPHRKLVTDKMQELPDNKSGVSRQTLISKTEKPFRLLTYMREG